MDTIGEIRGQTGLTQTKRSHAFGGWLSITGFFAGEGARATLAQSP